LIYFTSDLHLNHDRDFIYGVRGFKSIDEMNEAIIKNWNKTVNDSDTVCILGDIMLGDNKESIELFNKLKGQKFIVLGNHDTSDRAKIYAKAPSTTVL
jgi:calcineurin-like phosphoesterase family protein